MGRTMRGRLFSRPAQPPARATRVLIEGMEGRTLCSMRTGLKCSPRQQERGLFSRVTGYGATIPLGIPKYVR